MPRRLFLAACALAIAPMLVSCGDDDGDNSGTLPSPSASMMPAKGTVSDASPKVSKPAGKYSVSIEDIGNAWLTDIAGTYVISAESYCKLPCLFENQAEGQKYLEKWGYIEGYETAYIPEGRDETVLKGGYYIKVETHLFDSAEGAQSAYDYFTQYAAASGASEVPIQAVGNGSSAYATLAGTISGTRVKALFHQIVFVRGNVLTVILTKGAQGFMTADSAWDLAAIADAKLLGTRSAPEPTPTSNYKTPTPEPKQ